MPAFEKIQITSTYSNKNGSDGKSIVRIHSSEEYRFILTIDSNLSQYVKINSIDNVLKIETIQRIESDFIVDVYTLYTTDFENMVVEQVPAGWNINTPANTSCLIETVEGSDNKCMRMWNYSVFSMDNMTYCVTPACKKSVFGFIFVYRSCYGAI